VTPRRHILRADDREQDITRALSRLECVLMLDADDMREVDLAPVHPGRLLLHDAAAVGKGLQINHAASLLIGGPVRGDALVLPVDDFRGRPA
jgi:hypothetical protein